MPTECDGGSVALTETELDDAGVSTGAVADLLSHYAEEFLQRFLVLQIAEHDAA